MHIVKIFPPYIYSIKYDKNELSEYDRLFDEWQDVGQLMTFFEENRAYLRNEVWKNTSSPELAVQQVLDEAAALEQFFESLPDLIERGECPDLDSHFHFLEGKYKYEMIYIPVKSYGMQKPSFLRLYAIKMKSNTYLITGGGIKLSDTIQNSPGLQTHILQDIDKVRAWLKQNGIMDDEDMNND